MDCPVASCFDCMPPAFQAEEPPASFLRDLASRGFMIKSTVFYRCDDCAKMEKSVQERAKEETLKDEGMQ